MRQHVRQTGLRGYIFGFLASIVLTVLAYYFVVWEVLPTWPLIWTVLGLGFLQTIVQLVYFLYLGKEEKPRRNLMIFLFMVLVLLIIIGGTIWIMYALDWRTMPYMDMWRKG